MSSTSENSMEKSHIYCNRDWTFHSSHGLKQHQRSCQSRNNRPTDRESTEIIENSQFSTKTSKSPDELSTQREKHMGKVQRLWVWKELITSLWNSCVLEKKSVPATIWESRKKVYQRSFKINKWMATWRILHLKL